MNLFSFIKNIVFKKSGSLKNILEYNSGEKVIVYTHKELQNYIHKEINYTFIDDIMAVFCTIVGLKTPKMKEYDKLYSELEHKLTPQEKILPIDFFIKKIEKNSYMNSYRKTTYNKYIFIIIVRVVLFLLLLLCFFYIFFWGSCWFLNLKILFPMLKDFGFKNMANLTALTGNLYEIWGYFIVYPSDFDIIKNVIKKFTSLDRNFFNEVNIHLKLTNKFQDVRRESILKTHELFEKFMSFFGEKKDAFSSIGKGGYSILQVIPCPEGIAFPKEIQDNYKKEIKVLTEVIAEYINAPGDQSFLSPTFKRYIEDAEATYMYDSGLSFDNWIKFLICLLKAERAEPGSIRYYLNPNDPDFYMFKTLFFAAGESNAYFLRVSEVNWVPKSFIVREILIPFHYFICYGVTDTKTQIIYPVGLIYSSLILIFCFTYIYCWLNLILNYKENLKLLFSLKNTWDQEYNILYLNYNDFWDHK